MNFHVAKKKKETTSIIQKYISASSTQSPGQGSLGPPSLVELSSVRVLFRSGSLVVTLQHFNDKVFFV